MDAEDSAEPAAKALKVVDLSKVRRQVEFYFTDRNLSRDVALREAAVAAVPASGSPWLSVQWLLRCPKLQREGITLEELHTAVKASDLLELDEEANQIRRKEEYGPWPSLKLPCRPGGTVLVLRKIHDSSESTGESEDCSSASQGEGSSPSQEICRMESQECAQHPDELPLESSKDEASPEAPSAQEAPDTAEAAEATVEAEAEKGTTRAAARRFLRDWQIPKTAICGLSEPNSFGEVVVALHPFPGDLHLLTTAAPEGWEPRALFGSQRFKALQFLPKRVRRELLEGPAEKNGGRQLAREAGISLSEVERYRAMFDEFDTDGSAEISQAEFVFVIMQILEVKDARDIPTPILNRYWQEVDADGSGEVSFREFLYWMLTKGIG